MGGAAAALGVVALFAGAGLAMRWWDEWQRLRLAERAAPPLTAVATSADGLRFIADPQGVRILPPGELKTIWPVRARIGADWNLLMFQRSTPVDPRTHAPLISWVPGTWLGAGDLVGARLLAPAAEPPWRLEALGRDRDYRMWEFENEADARAALAMLERRVVRRLPFDPRPWPPQAGDFERALRERVETERELSGPASDWTWSVSGGDWIR